MSKRMLIDATHAEETRVVVLDGNRLEDFDVETSTKKQLKGNVYLAKIVRVEPSLQAAFVEYGGNRHGFLAFGEIHPDYYQIPVADRQRLIAQQEQEAREAEEAEDAAASADEDPSNTAPDVPGPSADALNSDLAGDLPMQSTPPEDQPAAPMAEPINDHGDPQEQAVTSTQAAIIEVDQRFGSDTDEPSTVTLMAELGFAVDASGEVSGDAAAMTELHEALVNGEDDNDANQPAVPPPETVGGESEERDRRTPSPRFLRHYKIQEVIRRRQILLVQVVKEERGGKGAALTTYVSLAGRFCVLMPNSPRGGGVSRKITSAADRRRLKEVTADIGLPSGMGLIVRTAGAARPKPEIIRDCEYLLQLWDDIRETTLKSMAPALIYEEASLIKRAIRDVYSRDVDEVLVDGEQAWRAARDQMRLLMPSHASKVQLWHDTLGQKLFAKHAVDAQLDAMLSPTVQLRSGGYLVINQTEALVAIDVNSGRSTRERGIEETAVRTNLEAAEEVARQLRLRDLAGLIVIDFIDMEVRRNNAAVERKLKDALKDDRARIQVGVISPFGLLEMSRQRLRPSLAETSFVQCSHCSGTGLVRSTEGASIHVLRAIEEEGGKRRSAEIMVHVAGPVAMYILNHKRERLREIEARYGMVVLFEPDPTLLPPAVKIDKLRALLPGEAPAALAAPALPQTHDQHYEEAPDELLEAEDAAEPAVPASALEPQNETEAGRRRRRRRRRGGRRDDAQQVGSVAAPAEPGADQPEIAGDTFDEDEASGSTVIESVTTAETGAPASSGAPANDPSAFDSARRRGRRGGRRRRKDGERGETDATEQVAPDRNQTVQTGYIGPTPADPFGGGGFDIFDVLEQAEARAEAALMPVQESLPALPTQTAASPPAPVDLVPISAEPVPVPAVTPGSPLVEPALVEPTLAELEVAAPVVAEPEPQAAPAKPRSRKPRAGSKAAMAAAAALITQMAAEGSNGDAPPSIDSAPVPDPAVMEPPVEPVIVQTTPDAPKRGWWRR